eukprot:jgi/Tetstr1/457368/TSEL_043971.t1
MAAVGRRVESSEERDGLDSGVKVGAGGGGALEASQTAERAGKDRPQADDGYGIVAEGVAPVAEQPAPLGEVLQALFPEQFPTASSARKSLRGAEIRVDGRVRKAGFKVQGGEVIERWQRTVSAQQLDPQDKVPAGLELTVLRETDTWAAVLKPAGVPTVVPTDPAGWTAERLLPYYLSATSVPGALWRPRTVHRLDSPTAGVLCCAKSREALRQLSAAFSGRRAHKRYRALLVGRLEGRGVVETPLKSLDNGHMQEAETEYAAVAHTESGRWGCLTTVDLWPHTGRTHQLRRHMAGLGHPILGDKKYARREHLVEGEGLFLFAAELSVPDPDSPGDTVTVMAPEADKFERMRQAEAGGAAT